ncbi:hypothetical protein [Pseudovibrio axinellae]|nr:hypothetical protein [Pseudovibrio axinellae]
MFYTRGRDVSVFSDIFGLTVRTLRPITQLIESDGAAGDGTLRS